MDEQKPKKKSRKKKKVAQAPVKLILLPEDRKRYEQEAAVTNTPLPMFQELEHPIFRKQKISKKALPSFIEAVLVACAPTAMRASMKMLLDGALAGDMGCVSKILEIYGLTRSKEGTTITNVIQNVQSNSGGGGNDRSFDAIARMLAERRGVVIDATPTQEG